MIRFYRCKCGVDFSIVITGFEEPVCYKCGSTDLIRVRTVYDSLRKERNEKKEQEKNEV